MKCLVLWFHHPVCQHALPNSFYVERAKILEWFSHVITCYGTSYRIPRLTRAVLRLWKHSFKFRELLMFFITASTISSCRVLLFPSALLSLSLSRLSGPDASCKASTSNSVQNRAFECANQLASAFYSQTRESHADSITRHLSLS